MVSRRHLASLLFLAATVVMISAEPGAAQTAEPIRYILSFPAPQTHYAEVTASVPRTGSRSSN
jgi:hypothetical protein